MQSGSSAPDTGRNANKLVAKCSTWRAYLQLQSSAGPTLPDLHLLHLLPQHEWGRPGPRFQPAPRCLAGLGQHDPMGCSFTGPIFMNLEVFQIRISPPGVISFPDTSLAPPGKPELGFRRQSPLTHHSISCKLLVCKAQRKGKGSSWHSLSCSPTQISSAQRKECLHGEQPPLSCL